MIPKHKIIESVVEQAGRDFDAATPDVIEWCREYARNDDGVLCLLDYMLIREAWAIIDEEGGELNGRVRSAREAQDDYLVELRQAYIEHKRDEAVNG